ncbi:MAG: BBP7 family outer membrane beta-barrel protein [Planctomycetes bacterium]|nr:BBP7 family outer membrane beta-barrel protein [Planctomycetota bacterium]
MKWFRRTFVWAAAGCLSTAGTTWAQAPPAAVTLGRPTPLTPIVRGARPQPVDEPNSLLLPDDIAPLPTKKVPAPFVPTQALQPDPKESPKVIEIDQGGKDATEKIGAPKQPAPATDESIIILGDGTRFGRSLFGFDGSGDRRFYARGEFLFWNARGFHVPILATTASATDNPDTRAALGFQSTRALFGDSNLVTGARTGARVTLGYDFDPTGMCTIEASFFFLGTKAENIVISSQNFPVIGRPFFNINDGVQARELTTTPEFVTGNLQVHASTSLWGAEINRRVLLWNGCDFEVNGLIGIRYLDLTDRLSIEENSTFINAVPAAPGNPPIFAKGDRTFLFDRFDTFNRFYGGQVGINSEFRRGPWTLDVAAKVGLGVTRQTVVIDGAQRFDRANGTVQNFRGGLYALSSNIGHHSQSRFGVVPEIGLKLGYNLTDNIRVFVGYDFLYWNSVLRAGDQIDTALDANRIPNIGKTFTPATQVRPVAPFRTSSYWATGVNAGFEIRY